ncbi:Transcriptional regulator, PAS and GerE domains (plasmid) [Sodalis praecaptivus]|uniref:Transcriptional regulator, PAS and GerE domains n=1 Tax=Sodalis praecaptivus TaxID=1239307 RepID=W0HZN6_9GAMM|nr:PAS and helix-turn-helix domain-containing protein [Sodalis praecaptivus]AHF79301.1 Transcriptional regulator, PAS and GerE domains [Sodalis praecaptivus]
MIDIGLTRTAMPLHIIYMCESNSHPCQILDSESRYTYINPPMIELLNLAGSSHIEGKKLSEIPHWSSVFADELHGYYGKVMENKTTLSLLVTCAFGRESQIQTYIFKVQPFFDDDGNVIGSMAEARRCKFFSPIQYIDNESPVSLSTHAPHNYLKSRDVEIIFFIYHGLTSKETARRLGISHRTVENRLCIMYQKANIHNIYQFREWCKDIGYDCYIPPAFIQSKIQVID